MTDLSLAHLVDDVKQAVVVVDLEGNITHWNEYAEELYGWRRHEVIGRRVTTMLAAPSMVETGEQILATLLRGSTWVGAFTNKHRDGTEIEVFAIVAPVIRQGKLVGSFGVSVPLNVPSRESQPGAALTAREREVLRLIAEAKKSNEIAKILGLSRRTVESHLANIYRKLGIASRSELILFAIRNGILGP